MKTGSSFAGACDSKGNAELTIASMTTMIELVPVQLTCKVVVRGAPSHRPRRRQF